MFLRTASRIAWRDLKASPTKFLFVTVAVAVGVAALTGVKGFGYAFSGMLLQNARQLIAADVQGQTWTELSPDQLRRLTQLGARFGQLSRVTETVSMARATNNATPQMISVKAVDPACYPFYGALSTSPSQRLPSLLANDASAIVTPELLLRLKTAVGGRIRIGERDFTITGTLLSEPDRLASGFGPGMRALITRGGLDRTGLIQFGSRAGQRFLFKMRPGVSLDSLRADLRSIVPRINITDYREGSPAIAKALDNTTNFLSLTSLIALIVGSLGVAMAMHSHLQQRMDSIAVFKALGARSDQVIQIYLIQTLWLGLAGGLLGVAIGAAVQRSFPLLMKRIFDLLPVVPWNWSFSLQGLTLGLLATLFFTVPPLLNIRNVRPNLVLRRNMDDGSSAVAGSWRDRLPGLLGALLLISGFTGIAAWLSGSWRMGFYFIAGLGASILLLMGVAGLLLVLMRWLVRLSHSALPAPVRHGFANLYRPGNQARSVLVALGVGVMFTLTTYLLQSTVLRNVTSEGPGREGNLFLLDVRDTAGVSRLIEAQPGVSGKVQLVGYIVSRMLSNNGIPVSQLALTRQRRDQLQTVRLTTAAALPDGVELKNGHWWAAGADAPQLAVSEQAAHDYNLHVGDQLQFQIAGRLVKAPLVAVFRRLQRAPVRYDLVFPRAALQGMPVVYYGAAHVDARYIPRVESLIFEKFPTVTVMNLADVLQSIQQAVDQVAVVIQFLAGFAILAGIIILSSSVAGTRYRRVREVAILKALGGTRTSISRIFSVEFTILGATAGLVGGLLANTFTGIISERFIEAPFDFDWRALLVAIIATALLANIAGWLASARILSQRPLEVLRGE